MYSCKTLYRFSTYNLLFLLQTTLNTYIPSPPKQTSNLLSLNKHIFFCACLLMGVLWDLWLAVHAMKNNLFRSDSHIFWTWWMHSHYYSIQEKQVMDFLSSNKFQTHLTNSMSCAVPQNSQLRRLTPSYLVTASFHQTWNKYLSLVIYLWSI